MNALLWVLQVAGALLFSASGVMKVFMLEKVSHDVPSFGALPKSVWRTLGVAELVCTAGPAHGLRSLWACNPGSAVLSARLAMQCGLTLRSTGAPVSRAAGAQVRAMASRLSQDSSARELTRHYSPAAGSPARIGIFNTFGRFRHARDSWWPTPGKLVQRRGLGRGRSRLRILRYRGPAHARPTESRTPRVLARQGHQLSTRCSVWACRRGETASLVVAHVAETRAAWLER